MGNLYMSVCFFVGIYGYSPQESLETTINTMGTLLVKPPVFVR